MSANKVKNSPFEFLGQTIKPGQRALVEMPAAQLYTNTPLNIPVHVVHGREPGPVLLICAAIHGDELNGVEIIRRVLQIKSLSRLKGTLIAVPVVNAFGFIHKSRYLPDRRDLNRCFPGSEKGSLGSRMAWLFQNEVLSKATHAVDLHTGAIHRSNVPQIRANLDGDVTAQMASAFNVPLILNSVLREGTFREVAEAKEIPVITYEAGEALRLDESSIRVGVRGIVNVMRHLSMLAKTKKKPPVGEPFIARSSQWIRADRDGMFRAMVALGQRVKKGDLMGRINSPFADGDELDILAPFAGILIGRNNLPLVNEGEALFHLARFEEVAEVAEQLEQFNTVINEEGPMVDGEPPIIP